MCLFPENSYFCCYNYDQINKYFFTEELSLIQLIIGGTHLSTTNDLIVYTLEFCPNCDTLKHYLRQKAMPFQERDLSTAESLTELRINGIFVTEAPVLQQAARFLTSADMFAAGALQEEKVLHFLEGT
jgi:hypothetical protein